MGSMEKRYGRPRRRRADLWDVSFRLGVTGVGWCGWIIIAIEPPEERGWVFWTGIGCLVLITVGALGAFVSYDRWTSPHRLRPWDPRTPKAPPE
jgi:hypothetical protein